MIKPTVGFWSLVTAFLIARFYTYALGTFTIIFNKLNLTNIITFGENISFSYELSIILSAVTMFILILLGSISLALNITKYFVYRLILTKTEF